MLMAAKKKSNAKKASASRKRGTASAKSGKMRPVAVARKQAKAAAKRAPAARRVRQSRAAPPNSNRFPVVAIGASAGGLEAITQLLKHLPADTGMAFVFIQHLDPRHSSQLPEMLGRATSMPVIEATSNRQLEPNRV